MCHYMIAGLVGTRSTEEHVTRKFCVSTLNSGDHQDVAPGGGQNMHQKINRTDPYLDRSAYLQAPTVLARQSDSVGSSAALVAWFSLHCNA